MTRARWTPRCTQRVVVLCTIAVVLARVVRASRDAFSAHAYLPDYRPIDAADGACASPHARVIAFSVYPNASGDGLENGASVAKKTSTCAMDLAVGGGGRSAGFVGAARAGSIGIDRLAAVVVRTVIEGDYDGVSYDWEYPVSDEDWRAYRELLVATRVALDASDSDGRRRRLSIAIHPSIGTFDALKTFRLDQVADWIHVMAYDSRSPTGHASLDFVREVIEHTKAHSDVSKLTLGIPFYARSLDNLGDVKTYEEIRRDASGAFDEKENRVGAFAFDSVSDVREKVRLASAAGYAGVMIWELGQDVQPSTREDSLFGAIASEVAKLHVVSRDEL